MNAVEQSLKSHKMCVLWASFTVFPMSYSVQNAQQGDKVFEEKILNDLLTQANSSPVGFIWTCLSSQPTF